MSRLSHSKNDSRPHLLPMTPCLTAQQEEKEIEEFVNLTTTAFEQLLDIWPFHRQQIDEFGQTRYCLTCLEKEQVKNLGLQNLFNMAWLKPDPRLSGPGRWKKI